MPRKIEVEVLDMDDKPHKVIVRALEHDEVEDIMRECGVTYGSNGMQGDFLKYVSTSIKKATVAPINIGKLPEPEYVKIRNAYNKVMGLTNEEKNFLPK
jgi:hypothetical protein